MTKEEFLRGISEVLLAEGPVSMETPLDSLPGWDSMGQVSTVSFLDEKLGVQPPAGALQRCRTIGDIAALAGEKVG